MFSDQIYVFKCNGLKTNLRCRYYKKEAVFKLNRDGEVSDFARIEFDAVRNGALFHIDIGEEVYSCNLQCDEEAKNLQLMVEDVEFTKLPLANEVDKLHRSPVANNFVGRELKTEYLLLFGDAYIKVVGKHDKKTNTTSLVCGKRKDVRKGIKLLHREKIALCLVLPEYQLKLSMRPNVDGDEFLLFVNGRIVYALPYIYGKSV